MSSLMLKSYIGGYHPGRWFLYRESPSTPMACQPAHSIRA